MNEIYIRYIDLPFAIKGQTVEDENGDYNIYINVQRSFEVQRKTILHEIRHIKNRDFENDIPIREIERRCNERQ